MFVSNCSTRSRLERLVSDRIKEIFVFTNCRVKWLKVFLLVWKHPMTEPFLIECLKTKTKAITMANHNKRKQHNEPMRTRSKYT